MGGLEFAIEGVWWLGEGMRHIGVGLDIWEKTRREAYRPSIYSLSRMYAIIQHTSQSQCVLRDKALVIDGWLVHSMPLD